MPVEVRAGGVVLRPRSKGGGVAGAAEPVPDLATVFDIHDAATGQPAGSLSLHRFAPGSGQAQIAYLPAEVDGSHAPTANLDTVVGAVTAASTWCFSNGLHRLEMLAAVEDSQTVRASTAAGFRHEGIRRGAGREAGGAPQDRAVFARLAGDPPGPAERALPDLPGGALSDGVVTLRPLQLSDVDDFLAMHSLPEVSAYYVGPPMTRELVTARCARADYDWVTGDRAQCAIVDTATGEFAGDIQMLNRGLSRSTVMLGYSLMRQARGKGFATRAVNLISDWAFSTGVVRVIAGTFPDNDRSRAVLHRAGFVHEGTLLAALPGPDGTRIDDIQFVRLAPTVAA